ncbi:MAG: VOC family protein [Longimicrobiales bacterium]
MSEQMGAGVTGIGQIMVPTRDLERAIAFYRNRLGLRFLFRAPPNMAFFDCGGVRLMLGVPEQSELDQHASIIYYRVGDIEVAHDRLAQAGVPFREAPRKVADLGSHDLWLAFFEDLDGNVLALMSEVPKP